MTPRYNISYNDVEGCNKLIDVDTDRVIWEDGHEPEDMTLSRDLGVFVDELNRLAACLHLCFTPNDRIVV